MDATAKEAPTPRRGSKGFTGSDGKFRAHIRKNRRHFYLGDFHSAEDAARAYDAAAIRLHGKFACLNFPLLAKPNEDPAAP